VERVILADSCILTDYLLAKTIWLVDGMRVDTARMRENLELTRGIIFSGQLLLDLAAAGMLREDAYRLVQGHAMQCWEHGGDFRAAVEADPAIGRYLTADKLQAAFSVDRQLANIDAIFSRVFAGEDA
jgi:adenylosuccinate lyase